MNLVIDLEPRCGLWGPSTVLATCVGVLAGVVGIPGPQLPSCAGAGVACELVFLVSGDRGERVTPSRPASALSLGPSLSSTWGSFRGLLTPIGTCGRLQWKVFWAGELCSQESSRGYEILCPHSFYF